MERVAICRVFNCICGGGLDIRFVRRVFRTWCVPG